MASLMRARPTATQRLTGGELVLSAGPPPRSGFSSTLRFAFALCLGAAGAQWLAEPLAPWMAGESPAAQAQAQTRLHELQRSLEQARLDSQLSQARSRELERQIDTLHQQLREAQEQLLFYRKAQQGRH